MFGVKEWKWKDMLCYFSAGSITWSIIGISFGVPVLNQVMGSAIAISAAIVIWLGVNIRKR